MTNITDSIILTGPNLSQSFVNDLIVTPTGGSQSKLADALAAVGGTPGGSNTQIQFNNNGIFGGVAVTGSGDAVLATSPVLSTPTVSDTLQGPTSGNLTIRPGAGNTAGLIVIRGGDNTPLIQFGLNGVERVDAKAPIILSPNSLAVTSGTLSTSGQIFANLTMTSSGLTFPTGYFPLFLTYDYTGFATASAPGGMGVIRASATGGASMTNNIYTIDSAATVSATPSGGSASLENHASRFTATIANATWTGNNFGAAIKAVLTGTVGSPGINSAIEVQNSTGGNTPVQNYGIFVQPLGTTGQGSSDDAAYSVIAGTGVVGFKIGLLLGSNAAAYNGTAISTTGTLIDTGSQQTAAGIGVDFTGTTFSGAAWKSTGATLDPTGIWTSPSFVVGASGPSITSGSAAPSATTPKGSIYFRTGGAVGTTLYVSQGAGTWNAVAGV